MRTKKRKEKLEATEKQIADIVIFNKLGFSELDISKFMGIGLREICNVIYQINRTLRLKKENPVITGAYGKKIRQVRDKANSPD